MQTPRPVNDPANTVIVLVAIVLSALLLVGQALFIVPAGKVAVVTTLGKVSGGSRLPGLNSKFLLSSLSILSTFAPKCDLKNSRLLRKIFR